MPIMIGDKKYYNPYVFEGFVFEQYATPTVTFGSCIPMISYLMATLPELEPYILMSAGHGKDVLQERIKNGGYMCLIGRTMR